MDKQTYSRALKLGKVMNQIADFNNEHAYDKSLTDEQMAGICEGLDSPQSYLNFELDTYKSCAAMGVVFDEHMHISPNQACHAGLMNQYGGMEESGATAVVSLLHDRGYCGLNTDEADRRLYLQWLFNESPYKSAFVTKSVDRALKQRFIVCNTDIPSNLLGGALIASRRITEYAYIGQAFCALVRAGFKDKNLAYLVSHLVPKGGNEHGINFTSPTTGHTSVDIHMSSDAVKNFTKNKPVSLNSTYNECWVYRGIDGTWGEVGYDDSYLPEFIKNNLDHDAIPIKRRGINPFPADPAGNDKVMPYEVGIQRMVDFETQLEEWMNE